LHNKQNHKTFTQRYVVLGPPLFLSVTRDMCTQFVYTIYKETQVDSLV